MNAEHRATQARRITLIGSLINIILTALKFIAGYFGQSQAMIADAVHSLSDFVTDLIVLAGTWFAKKPRDTCHHYGHGKFETLSTALIGTALGYAGLRIGMEGISHLTKVISTGEFPARPGSIAFFVALISIAAKEILYHITLASGKRINSSSVIANAKHHRSDGFSSIGAAVGIGAASFLGSSWTILDPFAAVVVSLFIIRSSLLILKESVNELLDRSLPQSVHIEIRSIASGVAGVKSPHNIRTRMIGPAAALELHIRVDPEMCVNEAHDITSEVEKRLRERFGEQTFVTVHVEPDVCD